MNEPAAAGNRPSGLWTPGSISSGVNIDLPGLTQASTQINSVTTALYGLKTALREVGSGSYMLAQGVNNLFQGITRSASQAAAAVNGVSSALGGVGGGGTGGGGGGGGGGGQASGGGQGVPSWVGRATAQAGAGGAATAGSGGSGASIPGSVGLEQTLTGLNPGIGVEQSFWKNLALFPLRFIRDMTTMNRNNVLTTEGALSRTAYASGAQFGPYATPGGGRQPGVLDMLSRRPGNVYGTIADQLSLFENASQYGAMYSFGGGDNAPRTSGYLEGVRQAQMITPGVPVAQIADVIGGQASNTGAQQASQMLTGGAMGMIKMGGGQKSLSEWAESVLRWLEGLRGGSKQGKAFNYGELIAQYFPGSNIDAWFDATGVNQEMREYWWSYALNKSKTGGTTGGEEMKITPSGDVVWNRLKATSQLATGQFGLGSVMQGAYSNKEQANQWFNRLMSDFTRTLLPSAVGGGNLNFMQYLPDTVEQLLMQFVERGGKAGTIAGGIAGYGGMFNDVLGINTSGGGGVLGAAGNFWDTLNSPTQWTGAGVARNVYNFLTPWGGLSGDVEGWPAGDIGDQYSTTGGTGTAGLHPDMRRKVDRMMQDNPNIRVNSGLRDNRMQQTLKRRGVGRVSGKPSAHTRGMAADLGPSSQYGWIVNNAAKYGLKSGVNQGEPWHVGMGDPEDDIEDLNSLAENFTEIFPIISGFTDLFGGSDPVGGVNDIVTSIFQMLQGFILGSKLPTTAEISSGLKPIPNLFDQLMAETKKRGITTAGPAGGFLFDRIDTDDDDTGTPTSGGDGGTGWTNTTGKLPDEAAEWFNDNDIHRAAATAAALYAAGFRDLDAIKNLTIIAGRESTWKPGAHRTDTNPPVWTSGDRGLFQINAGEPAGVADEKYRSLGLINSAHDLRDPVINARVAGYLSNGGSNLAPWGMGPGGWVAGGDPFYGTAEEKLIAEPGFTMAKNKGWLGDVEVPTAMGMMETQSYGDWLGDAEAQIQQATFPRLARPGSSLIQFNNTFNIQGGGGGGGAGNSGGIDIRRTVTMLANHLENEMNNRLLRAS